MKIKLPYQQISYLNLIRPKLVVLMITFFFFRLTTLGQTINSFPYTQNFESFSTCGTGCGSTCVLSSGWNNSTSDDLDWITDENGTSSGSTGPSANGGADHNPGTSGGNYLYVETSCSGTGYPNKTANLETPEIQTTAADSNLIFDFWYHMYGATMGNMYIDLQPIVGGTSGSWTQIYNVGTDNQDLWQNQRIDLNPYAGDTFRLRIRGVTGSSFTSDMAIDDVSIYQNCESKDTINVSGCNSYTSPSGIYTWTSSGTYLDTIPNAASCDSVITVNLTLNKTYDTITVSACEEWTSPSSKFYTSSGTINDTIMNVAGCDSIITVNLTIITRSTGADSLETIFSGGNGQNGNMFDVEAYNDVSINAISISPQGSSGTTMNYSVYYKNGTYVGHESSSGSWTLLSSGTVVSNGNAINLGNPLTKIDLSATPLMLTSGNTYGLYVTLTNSSQNLNYTNGANTYTNSDLKITTGVGKAALFSSTFSPRTWNGILHYGDGIPNNNNIYVDSAVSTAGCGFTWAAPFKTLQEALNYAQDNDVDSILIAEGTYCATEAPNGSTDPEDFAFYLNDSNVVVIGGYDPSTGLAGDPTILCAAISGTDTSNHVLVTSGLDTNSRFENLTITGGRAGGNTSYTIGGRTYYSFYGGGVYNNLSSPVYKNVTITDNEAKNGGGMYNYTSAPCIENSTIQNNKATYDGGGMYNIAGASPKVTDVTIQNNSAANNGGGIMNVSSSNPVLTRVSILSNTAGIRGGGMYSRSAGNAIGYDLIFNGNTAGYYGGGMYNYDYASPVITNVVFSNNSAQTGGAVYNFFQSNPVLVNATYTNNTGSTTGGAMYNSSSMPTVKNSIFIDNSNDITNTSSMLFGSFNASDEGTSSGANVGSGFLSLSGASASDVFVNPSDLDGADDVWMTADDGLVSKLCNNTIDAGSNSNLPNYISTDIAGNDRIAGSTTDLGAYEAMYTNGLRLPTTAGTYTSDKTYINGSWVYYCDCNTESVLLALDTTGSGAVVPATGVSLKIGNYPTISWSNDGGLITNTKGGAMIDRRWNVSPTTQPSGTVGVKYFFTEGEYEALVDTLANHNGGADPTTIDDVTELNMYKIANTGTFLDPHSSGITGIILSNDATTASTTKWVYEAYGSDHSAAFKVTSFSGGGGGNGGGSAPLPVELINFTATPIANHEAKLDWATASEMNNSHFNVERSYDGRNFEAIDRVEGSGNSNEVLVYNYIDQTIESSQNTVYYRLHQFDFDGKSEYTIVRRVDFSLDLNLDLINVYPNPFRNEVFISSNNLETESYTITVTAMNGAEVMKLEVTDNMELQRLDMTELSDGVYILKINSESASQNFRIIKN